MSWNKMFDECIKLKHDYIKHFGDYVNFNGMINTMKEEGIPYNEIFDEVQINQKDDLVLIRYKLHEMGRNMWKDEDSPLREARSLVFDIKNEEMVLTPFRKFFNMNEVKENMKDIIEEEINNCDMFEVSEKLDGSMQSYRYYNGKIVGSGSISLDINNSFRLKEGFEMLTDNHKQMIRNCPTITFVFEYISEKDKHVIPYDYSKEKGLYLIGMRSVLDGKEYDYKHIKKTSIKYNVPCCEIYQYNTLEEVLEHLDKMTIKDGEGFVLNIDGHKVKLKCEDYLQLHKLKDKLSSANTIIKAYADGTIDDLYANMPPSIKKENEDTIKLIEDFMVGMNMKITKNKINIELLRNKGKLQTDKELHKYINCLDSDIKEFVRMKFLGRKYNILKSHGGAYRKYNEIRKWVEENCKEF